MKGWTIKSKGEYGIGWSLENGDFVSLIISRTTKTKAECQSNVYT